MGDVMKQFRFRSAQAHNTIGRTARRPVAAPPGGRRLALATLAALLVAAPLLAQKVSVDYNRHVNFAQFHTFSWTKVKAQDPLWADRIKRAVDAVLARKGLHPVPHGGQLRVSALGTTHQIRTIRTFYDNGWGPGWGWWGWGPGMTTTTIERQPVGTVVVDLFDAGTHHLVFRGIASHTIQRGQIAKNERQLRKALEKMFKKWPPGRSH